MRDKLSKDRTRMANQRTGLNFTATAPGFSFLGYTSVFELTQLSTPWR